MMADLSLTDIGNICFGIHACLKIDCHIYFHSLGSLNLLYLVIIAYLVACFVYTILSCCLVRNELMK